MAGHGEYFLDQLKTELGDIKYYRYGYLHGDYNFNNPNETEKNNLDIFALNSGLEIVKLRDSTRCTDKRFKLFGHCFISFEQIIVYKATTTPLSSNNFPVIFKSNQRFEQYEPASCWEGPGPSNTHALLVRRQCLIKLL